MIQGTKVVFNLLYCYYQNTCVYIKIQLRRGKVSELLNHAEKAKLRLNYDKALGHAKARQSSGEGAQGV